MPLMYVLLEHFLAKQINKVSADIEYIALHIIVAGFFCWFDFVKFNIPDEFCTKKAKECVYSNDYRFLLLSVNMFYTLR